MWDQKKPERHPEAEVKLTDDLWMPAAAHLDSIVDLEDWIREAGHQIQEDNEAFRIFVVPLVTALMAGGVLGVIGGAPVAGWSAVAIAYLVPLGVALRRVIRRNTYRDRNRRVDAYKKRLRDLRIPPNTEPEARPTPS